MTETALQPTAVDAQSFAPFGQLISPGDDGTPFGPEDAALDLSEGTPRLYIMRLKTRGLSFDRITRHAKVTQCLAAMGGKEWFVAVAPPGAPGSALDPASIRAFRVPGTVAIKLHRGAWHAGPYFSEPTIDFLNLELADTNEVDHENCHLLRDHGVSFRFEA